MGIRKVDVSALPTTHQFVGETYHTIYDPILVFEGKRLPAPSRGREREYVTGGLEKSGGIQRFKLSLHGARQNIAVLVGYVQKGTLQEWHNQINDWIRELATSAVPSEETWFTGEQLTAFVDSRGLRVSSASSRHQRLGEAISPQIVTGF